MKIKNLFAYHISSDKYDLGECLKPKTRIFDSEPKSKSEEFMEEIRTNKYQDNPSRLTSIFVSPDMETAKRWRNKKGRFQPTTIYEVELSGDLSAHISDYYEECFSFFDNSPYKIRTECETKEEAANKYWTEVVEFKTNDEYLVEGLFVGEAKVVGIWELK